MFCHEIESLSRAEADSSTQLNWTFSFPSFIRTWENVFSWNLVDMFSK